MVLWLSLSFAITGQDTFNAPSDVSSFTTASPCLDTCLGQRGGQRHVGWQDAEVVRW